MIVSSFVLDGSTSFCTHKLPKPIVAFHYDHLTLIQMEVHHFNLTYSTPKKEKTPFQSKKKKAKLLV